MMIKRIHIANFKSFKDEEINLEPLNVLIGANASGKSNTVGIFRFIDQIINYGIENAISLSGGMDYLLNASIGKKNPLVLDFSISCIDKEWVLIVDKKESINLLLAGFDYSFEITPHKRGNGYRITKDVLEMKYYQAGPFNSKAGEENIRYFKDKPYVVEYRKVSGKFSSKVIKNQTDFTDSKILKDGLDSGFIARRIIGNQQNKELLLNMITFFMPPMLADLIRIFDFDPKLMKRSCLLTSTRILEEDGSNIANILQSLLKSKVNRKKLINLLADCLPFVEQIHTENNFDKSITYKLKEKYTNKMFHANFLSDGSVSILAIIIALYFEKNIGVIVLEEPERNVHPALMEKIMLMAKEAAKEKQVIITTHTPELIKYADNDSILLSKRCDEGFTCIKKPIDSTIVKEFVKNEIGLNELFIQNILGE